MKKMILYAVMALMSLPVGASACASSLRTADGNTAAESEAQRKEKEEKKRAEERLDSLRFSLACQSVEDGYFVVVADQIRGRYGRSVNVNESTNFVLVQGDKATVQFAIERGFSGPNGLGGITVEGRVSNVKIQYDKRGNLVYSMSVTGTAISADVYFTLPKNGTKCDVTVNSNYSGNRLTFSGELNPYKAEVFQGRTIK